MNRVNINRDLSFDVIDNFGIILNRNSTSQSFELIEEELIPFFEKMTELYISMLDNQKQELISKLEKNAE